MAGLDHQTVGEILQAFTECGMLVRTEAPDGAVYELTRRDWSAAPDTPGR